jgi:branched-chain amino acid transport system substrate-binding protein
VQANFSSMEGYLAAKLFCEGLRRAGSKPSRESLISGLESIGSQSFGGFSVAFSPGNHVASRFVELSMLTGDGRVRT